MKLAAQKQFAASVLEPKASDRPFPAPDEAIGAGPRHLFIGRYRGCRYRHNFSVRVAGWLASLKRDYRSLQPKAR